MPRADPTRHHAAARRDLHVRRPDGDPDDRRSPATATPTPGCRRSTPSARPTGWKVVEYANGRAAAPGVYPDDVDPNDNRLYTTVQRVPHGRVRPAEDAEAEVCRLTSEIRTRRHRSVRHGHDDPELSGSRITCHLPRRHAEPAEESVRFRTAWPSTSTTCRRARCRALIPRRDSRR